MWWTAVTLAWADPTVPAGGSVFLRSSFDADGSPFVGRFIPTGAGSVDETAAMPTVCSRFVTYQLVPGGGVTYSELMEVSDKVAGRLGAVVGNLKLGQERRTVTRVDYELTAKLVATVDAQGMQRCCQEQPGQCTDRYVGSVLQGKGSVFREKTSTTSGSASGVHPTAGVTAGITASHGTHWEQAVTFPEPVFFAFELTENPYRRVSSAGSCGDWVDRVPQADGGRYLVGTSKASKTEEQAKTRALRDAWKQAAMAGGGAVFDPDDPSSVQAAQMQGMAAASQVQAREWCVERTSSQRYVARVLAWWPQ
jgi:hypothetical protein